MELIYGLDAMFFSLVFIMGEYVIPDIK
jgi:hypothetical protein